MEIVLGKDFAVWDETGKLLRNKYHEGSFDHLFASTVIACLGELLQEDIPYHALFEKSRKREVALVRGFLVVRFHRVLVDLGFSEKNSGPVARVTNIFCADRSTYHYFKNKRTKEIDHLFRIVEKSDFARRVEGHLEVLVKRCRYGFNSADYPTKTRQNTTSTVKLRSLLGRKSCKR